MQGCNTQINVNNTLIFGCSQGLSSHALNVQTNQSVVIQAEYRPPSTSGVFLHCIGFQENGIIFI